MLALLVMFGLACGVYGYQLGRRLERRRARTTTVLQWPEARLVVGGLDMTTPEWPAVHIDAPQAGYLAPAGWHDPTASWVGLPDTEPD